MNCLVRKGQNLVLKVNLRGAVLLEVMEEMEFEINC